MDIVEVSNATSEKVPLSFCKKVSEGVVTTLKKSVALQDTRLEISIAFVDEKRIREVNMEYREKDESTDVLSFCYEKKHDTIHGELLLCWPMIRSFAIKDGNNSNEELKKNIVHGLLHVVGFKHGDEMFSLQTSILKRCS